MARTKVFGIGFQKTGTTTLGAILDQLGYRTASYHSFRDFAKKEGVTWEEVKARALKVARDHDAGKDTPWPLLYDFLDREFPGSKFVHVVRKPESWIRSAVHDFKDHPNALHTLIYGVPSPLGNEAVWLERYKRHNEEVAAYFADRPGDYIRFQLEDGIDVPTLCEFLGQPAIDFKPPVANTRMRKTIKMAWWKLTGQS
ncbi:sulfotransferase [Sphingomonas sp.]|uniref:sulfotransferase n=1 Tax=Sphingomonas sp. TaxID=28214 RepID=UPI001B151B6C|nr:sulfotransferase [Sphingomonas sp.]MBO9714844.1 hypothetical protein [Sphingomonas sp.]